jgi:hypothetical protein
LTKLPPSSTTRIRVRKTLNVGRLSAAQTIDLRVGWLFDPEPLTNGDVVEYPRDVERPQTRGDCVDGPRPCPFVSCRHHLYLDVNPRNGAIKHNFPELEVWEMAATCALDIAERTAGKGVSLGGLARAMGLSYDRAFQVTDEAKRRAAEVVREMRREGDDE